MKIYEGCFILSNAGKETEVKDLIDLIEKQIRDSGGKALKIQRMDKRPFARITGKIDNGYYVNYVFEMEPEKLNAFRDKFKLNEGIYRLLISEAAKGAENREPVQVTTEAA
jgi:small subunit ribosomal protein S6